MLRGVELGLLPTARGRAIGAVDVELGLGLEGSRGRGRGRGVRVGTQGHAAHLG